MATLSERLRGIAETSMFSVAPEYHEMADQALALEQDLAEALKRAEEAERAARQLAMLIDDMGECPLSRFDGEWEHPDTCDAACETKADRGLATTDCWLLWAKDRHTTTTQGAQDV